MTDVGQGRPPRGEDPERSGVRWRSAAQLEKEFVGSHTSFGRILQKLRQSLLADVIAAGFSEDEAEAMVNEHLIQMIVGRDGRERPVASDDALRLMELVDRRMAEPTVPEGWTSALRLSQKRGEDYHAVVRRLKGIYRDALCELRQQGHTDRSAATAVEQLLVRSIRPVQGKRRIWIASEEAVRQLDTGTPRPDLGSRVRPQEESWSVRIDGLVADMISGGYSTTEAISVIRQYLEGRPKSISEQRSRGQ